MRNLKIRRETGPSFKNKNLITEKEGERRRRRRRGKREEGRGRKEERAL